MDIIKLVVIFKRKVFLNCERIGLLEVGSEIEFIRYVRRKGGGKGSKVCFIFKN